MSRCPRAHRRTLTVTAGRCTALVWPRVCCWLVVAAPVPAACTGHDPAAPTPDAGRADLAAPSDSGVSDGAAHDGSAADPFRSVCLDQINTLRARVSSPPLALWTAPANVCADDQARKGAGDFIASGQVVFHKYFGQCKEQFQNECWYSSSDATAMMTWCNDAFFAEGPPPMGQINHYSTMVNPKATAVACGLFPLPPPKGGWWLTQDFIE